MELIISVKRIFKGPEYTIGKVYLNGEYLCDSLEDVIRDKNDDGDLTDPGEEKVWGKTAIPKGSYNATVYYWEKHKNNYLLLHDVPGFFGILIHGGITAEDTHGCILVGWNKVKGKLLNSFSAMESIRKWIALYKPAKITVNIE